MESDDDTNYNFGISEDLVQSPAHKTAGTSSIDFDGLLSTPLKLQEDLAEGCGGQLWPAGMVLSKYLLRTHRDTMKGRTIVELGAGGGLVGLAVALGCNVDKNLLITDQKPMFALMQQNIALNNLQGRVEADIYDWGEAPPPSVPTHPDIILAADCVYFEPAFPLLQKTLQDLVGERSVCFFCFKKRRRADMNFVKAIKKIFTVEEVNDDPEKEVYGRENIFLYKIMKKD